MPKVIEHLPLKKTKICLSFMINTEAADDLVKNGTSPSAVMVLT